MKTERTTICQAPLLKKKKKKKGTKEEERWNQTSCKVQSQLTTAMPELTGKTLTEPDIHTVTRV